MKNKTFNITMVLFLMVLIIVGLLVSCSPQTQGWLDADYSNKVAQLPDDVCIRNGVPIIFGVSTESDGAVALIYLRNNGDIVTRHYPLTFPGTDWKLGGEFYWSGGKCNDVIEKIEVLSQ